MSTTVWIVWECVIDEPLNYRGVAMTRAGAVELAGELALRDNLMNASGYVQGETYRKDLELWVPSEKRHGPASCYYNKNGSQLRVEEITPHP